MKMIKKLGKLVVQIVLGFVVIILAQIYILLRTLARIRDAIVENF